MRKHKFLLFAALASMTTAFVCSEASAQNNQNLTQGFKKQTEHNPIGTQRFGADPFAMHYNNRVYVYMTNDIVEYDSEGNIRNNSYGKINKISCMSSDDMVNWTDHGAMAIAGPEGVAKWATNSWAPCACHKTINGKEKFFLYFANNGNGIGVVTSDTPFGPWEDPNGKALISRETPTCAEVTWLFDPAVLIDDNGDGYLYVGGGVPFGKFEDPGTARVCKLSDNLTALDGIPQQINPPYLFEDSGINKVGDTYYYSYCTNFNSPKLGNGVIAYMTSKSPMGPFEFKGTFFRNPGDFFGNGGNNHHAVCQLGANFYLFYHAQVLQASMGLTGGYRSTHVDQVIFNQDGSIQEVIGTLNGVEQFKPFNPFKKTEAETMAWMGGIDTKYFENSTNMYVCDIQNGDWIGLSKVDFGQKATSFSAQIASTEKGTIKICLDSADGECVGELKINPTKGKYKKFTTKLSKNISGVHDLFFVFDGSFNFDYWQFK